MSNGIRCGVISFFLFSGFGLSEVPNAAGKNGKYDTVLIDSLNGEKAYFRKFREKIVDPFVDSTDQLIEGVTESDSVFFRYSDTAGTKYLDVFRIPGKTRKAYLLHFDYHPSNPPYGQAFAIIAPVRGALKHITPVPIAFGGSLSGFSPQKASLSDDGFSVSIWNGNFGIEVPILLIGKGDSIGLTVPIGKSSKIGNSTASFFRVSGRPEKTFYREGEEVDLIPVLNQEKGIKIKTPKIEEIEVYGVWVRIGSKPKLPGLQSFFDACGEAENSILEVRIGAKRGFIRSRDFPKIGYQDAG
jgi:hypothetical protein